MLLCEMELLPVDPHMLLGISCSKNTHSTCGNSCVDGVNS